MFTDLHTHILPFMDDGANSYEESLEMLKIMESNGVTHVVATPHFSFDKGNEEEFINKREEVLDNLRIKAKEENINVLILSGAELMYSSTLHTKKLDEFVIEGTDYLLIELSTRRDHPHLFITLNKIIGLGYIPILAHVERYSNLIKNSQNLVDLVSMGVLLQVNSGSINNEKYPFINALMKSKLVHVIASDTHGTNARKPNLVKNKTESTYIGNQNKIINNELLDISKPRKIKKVLNKYF